MTKLMAADFEQLLMREEAMLGVRARPLDTRDAERQAEPIKRMLTFERRLQEELERFREQLDETKRELHLATERVQAAVETALALAGQPPADPESVRRYLAGPDRPAPPVPRVRTAGAQGGPGAAAPSVSNIRTPKNDAPWCSTRCSPKAATTSCSRT